MKGIMKPTMISWELLNKVLFPEAGGGIGGVTLKQSP